MLFYSRTCFIYDLTLPIEAMTFAPCRTKLVPHGSKTMPTL